MATMNLVLPEAMKDWVEAQARTGRFSNASDYVLELIRQDQERLTGWAELQELVTEGFESGVSTRSETEIRQLGREKLAVAKPL